MHSLETPYNPLHPVSLRFAIDTWHQIRQWEFVGYKILHGEQAVREYMAENYIHPPEFDVINFIAEGDFVTAIGEIALMEKDVRTVKYSYCDVWCFEQDKMASLRSFIIEEPA